MESPSEIAKWSGITCLIAFAVAALSFFPAALFFSTVGSPTEVHPLVLIVSAFLLFGSFGVAVVSFVLFVVARIWQEARPDSGQAPGPPAPPLLPLQPAKRPRLKATVAILLWALALALVFAVITSTYTILTVQGIH